MKSILINRGPPPLHSDRLTILLLKVRKEKLDFLVQKGIVGGDISFFFLQKKKTAWETWKKMLLKVVSKLQKFVNFRQL